MTTALKEIENILPLTPNKHKDMAELVYNEEN